MANPTIPAVSNPPGLLVLTTTDGSTITLNYTGPPIYTCDLTACFAALTAAVQGTLASVITLQPGARSTPG